MAGNGCDVSRRQVVAAALEAGAVPDEDGIEDAFELLNEVAEHARGGELPWGSIP